MQLYFFRADHPNFGDELAASLMPKLFPAFFDDDSREIFLSIGSVLDSRHSPSSIKVVFGAGYGGYVPPAVMDASWKVYCVRGPRTAKILGLTQSKVAGDAAIIINQFQPERPPVSRKLSFIPHWESIERGHWQAVCRQAGIHFIDPRLPVDEVLSDILKSGVVLAEAMHGAVVSDALRVPWIPILPFHRSHRSKWFDWAEALNLDLRHQRPWPSSVLEAGITYRQPAWPDWGKKGRSGMAVRLLRILDPAVVSLAATRLSWIARQEPMLSLDRSLDRVVDHLMTSAALIKRDFA